MEKEPSRDALKQRIRVLEKALASKRSEDDSGAHTDLIDQLLLGVTVWSRKGELLYANKGFNRLTGYTQTDIRNLEDWFSRAYPDPEYRKRVLAAWQFARRI